MEERALNYVGSNFVGKFGYVALVMVVFWTVRNVGFNWVVLSFLISSVLATLMNVLVFARLRNEQKEAGEPITEKDLFSYGFPYMLNNVMILVVPLVEKLIIRDVAGWQVLSIYTAAAIFQTVIMMLRLYIVIRTK